jgi:tRNA(His) 5'-end guanylyltransferase
MSEEKQEKVPLAREIEELGDLIKGLESFDIDEIKEQVVKFNPICFNRDRHLALRIDGHKFSTFTQGFDKPFDLDIMEAMCRTAEDVLKYFHGSVAYTQSDEITVLIPKPTNDASSYDFNGRKFKIETLAAGYTSARFNQHLLEIYVAEGSKDISDPYHRFNPFDPQPAYTTKHNKIIGGFAHFDCRGIQPTTDQMVVQCFRWRQLDAFRNGTSVLARDIVSEKKLLKLGTGERIKLLEEKKYPLTDKPTHILHGTWIKRNTVDQTIKHPKTGEDIQCKRTVMVRNPGLEFPNTYTTIPTPSFEWLIQ